MDYSRSSVVLFIFVMSVPQQRQMQEHGHDETGAARACQAEDDAKISKEAPHKQLSLTTITQTTIKRIQLYFHIKCSLTALRCGPTAR